MTSKAISQIHSTPHYTYILLQDASITMGCQQNMWGFS